MLLRSALSCDPEDRCAEVVQQAAGVGLMYLCTQAGELTAAELSMYCNLMLNKHNVEMIQFLTAGMWLLLKTPGNRLVNKIGSLLDGI